MKHYLSLLILLGLSINGFAQTKTPKGETSCTSFPCVVSTISVTNQSTKAPKTIIYTPTDLAGQPLFYTVSQEGGGGGGTNMLYNLTIIVEQLK
jgi:hypothetical protein